MGRFKNLLRKMHGGVHGYKIDYSGVAEKSRCVAGIGHIA